MIIDPADVALCIQDELPEVDGSTPTSVPITQTSLFSFPDFQSLVDAFQAENKHRIYSRGQNPTVEELERKLAALERGEAARAFASGMAAISAVFMGLLRQGDHILFVNQIYGPTRQLAEHLRRFGVEHDVCLGLDVDSIQAALRPSTRLLWMESPGTMLFRELDLAAIARLAKDRDVLTGIDNSWATPLLQKPIESGIDIVAHTATKYLGGHSDVLAGAVITTEERIRKIFYRAYLLNGGVLAPFDAWLLLRGMRTLPARLRQHESDGIAVARWLAEHSAVHRVYHPALAPDSERTQGQLSGYSGTFSFVLKDGTYDNVRRVIDRLGVFRIGVSWGGVESLVISPTRPTGQTGSEGVNQPEGHVIPQGLIRLSVGLEGAETLIDDLSVALT